ncbi:hypothetical protein THII_3359 [Thioploca ingrica]|jgi:uncharacterized protein (DUF433 family)|uniref:DUF433 domain-containing protein n=1 Tax=Thioploca ingrica TaxID=40754 RepID=A0A090BVY3_9GAMM|nr:hypothetical protein THII_3359 [Thioploca ingrica]
MKLIERITIDPHICHGKPCIRHLRYPVENILELLSAGMSVDEIVADYEDLEKEDILAVFAYATQLTQIKKIQIVAP